LEDKHRVNVAPPERIKLLLHEAKHSRGHAAQCICKGVLQSLDGAEPIYCINADPIATQILEGELTYEVLLGQMRLKVPDTHCEMMLGCEPEGGSKH